MPLAKAPEELLKPHRSKHLVMNLPISIPKLSPDSDYEGPERQSMHLIKLRGPSRDNLWMTMPENSQISAI